MSQLSYVIGQAREFFKSAETSGPSTRALMAYYGLTSLANAEILWHGTGQHSFDARKQRWNSHGFKLSQAPLLWDYSARPTEDDLGFNGLFGLWRQFALQTPLYSQATTYHPTGSRTNVLIASDYTNLADLNLPHAPLTLGDCLRHIPALRPVLDLHDQASALCRAKIVEHIRVDAGGKRQTRTRTFYFHHMPPAVLETVGAKFSVRPNSIGEFDIVEVGHGLIVKWTDQLLDQIDNVADFYMPEAFFDTEDSVFFVGDGEYLNEFGYYYVALYIAGMITRYHPNIWIKEQRASSSGAALIDELVEHAINRVPLLAASALERFIYLYG